MSRQPTVLLTAQEVAARLGEHLETVRTHTRRGDYKAFAINLGTENRAPVALRRGAPRALDRLPSRYTQELTDFGTP